MRIIAAATSALIISCLLTGNAFAEPNSWLKSHSLTGEPKYGQNFERYEHVKPDAPIGGTLNSIAFGTFDSFNPFIVKGRPAAGLTYFGGLLYDSLMEQSVDQASTSYGLIAEAFFYPEDYSWATYRLNPKAKWHDGKPMSVEDVIWSFDKLREHSPQWNRYYVNVKEAVKISDSEVKFIFDQTGNRELPVIMGDLPILPKHWWEGKDANGKQRDITNSTAEPPLGGGPYKIGKFDLGKSIIWERADEYWAWDEPARVGRYNFARLKYEYFRDEEAMWQAFTKGGFDDYRVENRSQKWSEAYTFPAFVAKDVKKETFKSTSGEAMQAFVMNQRRDQFKDARVREALTYAFDFETMNRLSFYDLYTRTDSYFEGGELAQSGLPKGKELEILEKYRGKIPDRVFTEEFKLPVYDSPAANRKNLRTAFKLLKEAGWESKGGKLINAKTGKQFTIEILGNDPTDERIAGPFIKNLKRLGINASLRIVDAAQFLDRKRKFDFDIVNDGFRQSQSPGNEQRDFWGSKAADIPGSRNPMGIKDEAVDGLINDIINAKDREELVAVTHALDRVLLWNFYVIPQWHNPEIWLAYWRKMEIPRPQPTYAGVDPWSMWIDKQAETELDAKYRN